jgi:hypothetical protein
MASEQTPEAKELALVGKVEMRIALASSEKKLEDLLKVYLSPLLLKLGSDSVAVRNKVSLTDGRLMCYYEIILNTADSGLSLGHLYLPTHQHPHQVAVRIPVCPNIKSCTNAVPQRYQAPRGRSPKAIQRES